MNWEALGALGEILGSIILIASVFYLSRQIRAGTDQATAEAESTVQRDFIQIQSGLISDEKSIDVLRQGYHSFIRLSDKDKYFFHMKISGFINHFEGVLRKHEKGLTSANMVETYGNIVLLLLGSPGGREFWNVAGETFNELSTVYINKHLDRGGDWSSMEEVFPYFIDRGEMT